MATPLPVIWRTLSHKVLSSILVDHGAAVPVRDIIGGNNHWFPVKDGLIWQAVTECLDADTPPTVEAVGMRAAGAVEPGYIQSIATLFNDDDNQRVVYHAQELKKLGMLAEVREIGRRMCGYEDADGLEDYLKQTTTKLTGILATHSSRDASAVAVGEAAWSMVENAPSAVIPTGMKWFDDMAGGLWPGFNYWIAAAYKQRKSTLMRNAVLAAAHANCPVGVFIAEGSREMFYLDCIAMLATKYMLVENVPLPKCRLSGFFLRNQIRKHRDTPVFTEAEWHAIETARMNWDGYPIWIWDSSDFITDLTTLHYKVKQAKLDHGCRAFWMDYSQLFGKGDTLFEQQSKTSRTVQQIATQEGVAMCVLAQKNEESIRHGGYSPGVKGGGDAHAVADFMFVTDYDQDEAPDVLKVELKLSRWTQTAQHTHAINPSSGLIVDSFSWMRTDKVSLNSPTELEERV